MSKHWKKPKMEVRPNVDFGQQLTFWSTLTKANSNAFYPKSPKTLNHNPISNPKFNLGPLVCHLDMLLQNSNLMSCCLGQSTFMCITIANKPHT